MTRKVFISIDANRQQTTERPGRTQALALRPRCGIASGLGIPAALAWHCRGLGRAADYRRHFRHYCGPDFSVLGRCLCDHQRPRSGPCARAACRHAAAGRRRPDCGLPATIGGDLPYGSGAGCAQHGQCRALCNFSSGHCGRSHARRHRHHDHCQTDTAVVGGSGAALQGYARRHTQTAGQFDAHRSAGDGDRPDMPVSDVFSQLYDEAVAEACACGIGRGGGGDCAGLYLQSGGQVSDQHAG